MAEIILFSSHSFGHLLKVLLKHEQQKWLECEDNLECWLGNDNKKLSAKQRRILLTHWVGEAYKTLQSERYTSFRKNCFEKTGCLITADGSHDEKIKPESLEGYKVTPPLPTPAIIDPFASVIPEPEMIPPDDVTGADDDEMVDVSDEASTSPPPLEMDNVELRDTGHNLVGCRIKALYDGEWFKGEISWYAPAVGKLRVYFPEDESDDYIGPEEINGVDVIVCT